MKKTYTQIAKNTGLSISHVSRVMRGLRSPSLQALALIAKEMGVPMSDVLKRMKIEDPAKTIKR